MSIQEFLGEYGIQPDIKGFKYISQAINLMQMKPELLMREIYHRIAEMCAVTANSVRACIRYAVKKYNPNATNKPFLYALLKEYRDRAGIARHEAIMRTVYIAKKLAKRYSTAYDFIKYQDLHDLCEETIIAVYDKWNPKRGEFKAFAWACCIKRINSYISFKKKRLAIEETDYLDRQITADVTLGEVLPSKENVQESVQARVLLQSVLRYAVTLSVLQRRILACAVNGTTSIRSIGKVLHMGRSCVHRQKNEAINRLKIAVGY